jgi:hypothetical protein
MKSNLVKKRSSLGAVFILAFLLVMTMTATMSSCSDDDVVAQVGSASSGIAFRLQSNLPATRATGTTVDNVNAFVVNAQDQRTGEPGSIIFDAQTVYRIEGVANAFDYNPKKYYPDESSEAYYSAYSPVTKNVTAGFKSSIANTITYEVQAPDPNKGNTTQEDLLVAYTKVEGATQTPGATPVDRKGFNEPVLLNFKHALSRVYVTASNANEEPVTITAISLNKLYTKGVLDIDALDIWSKGDGATADIYDAYVESPSTTSDYKVLWTPVGNQDGAYNYVLPTSGITVAARTANDPKWVVSREQGMLILPQTTINADDPGSVENEDFYLEVSYKLSNIETTVKAPFADNNNIADEGLTFEFGKQYALGIEFSGAAIRFSITVEDWNEPVVEPNAETTVVFSANTPVNATAQVADNQDPNSKFVDGQDLPTLSGDAPSLEGWNFQGYFDAPEGGKQYYDEDLVAMSGVIWDKAGPSHILYAQWEATTNTIPLDNNKSNYTNIEDIEDLEASISWIYDSRLKNLPQVPTAKGYIFAGLYTAATGGSKIYDAAGETSFIYSKASDANYVDADDLTDGKLWAYWTPKVFTVTIDLNGGTYKGSTVFTEQQTYSTSAFTLTSDDFSHANKQFGGLSSTKGGTADIYKYDSDWTWQTNYSTWTATDSNTTVYAVWVEP